jgi:predicted ATPase
MPFLLTGLQLSTINNQQSIFVSISFAVETSTLFDEEGLAQALKAIPMNSRICLHDENNDIDVYPQDVGVGVSQVLPIVVGALTTKQGFFAVEQPELRIHPALQVALGDLIAVECETWPQVSRGNQ